MIELLAIAPEDGWAFIRRDCQVLVVRPPYRLNSLSGASEATVQKAVSAHGFQVAQGTFGDWRSLVEFLREQIVEARKARGQKVPEPAEVKRLVRHAPPRVLERYLDRIESELLPGREWNAALELLTTLLRLDSVKKSSHLHSRAIELLEKLRESMRRANGERRELVDQEKDFRRLFPRATERYGLEPITHVARGIAASGQLLPVGAH